MITGGCGQNAESTASVNSSEINHSEASDSSYGTVTIQNGSRTVTFTQMPQKVLCCHLYAAENMVMLGLEDYIVGKNVPANAAEAPLPELADKFKDIPEVERSNENAVALGTDLMIGQVSAFKDTAWGSYKQFETEGINCLTITGTLVEDETINEVYSNMSLQITILFEIAGGSTIANELNYPNHSDFGAIIFAWKVRTWRGGAIAIPGDGWANTPIYIGMISCEANNFKWLPLVTNTDINPVYKVLNLTSQFDPLGISYSLKMYGFVYIHLGFTTTGRPSEGDDIVQIIDTGDIAPVSTVAFTSRQGGYATFKIDPGSINLRIGGMPPEANHTFVIDAIFKLN